MVGIRFCVVGVLVVTRLLFKDGIQLNGLPASPAEITDAYSPFHPAGQPFHRTQPHPQRHKPHHPHPTVGRSVSAQEPRLSPHTLAGAAVQHGGRSFLRHKARSRPPAHQPTKQYFMIREIKIVIILKPNTPLQQCLYFPSCVLPIWRSRYDRIDLHKKMHLLTSPLGAKGGVSFYLLAMITEHKPNS
jgi:hypothetical protein